MWWSVELLETGCIFIQPVLQRIKHGCKGKVLLPHVLYEIAFQIKNENQ